ncbi:MAG: efflux RND transporter periplasmic adaptor subunit [Deltaproteobacteria bacterium]|nr:MAG: efflux RND transporter periplasmic adaptor subunit [Deltaproteobacteria bacterium]
MERDQLSQDLASLKIDRSARPPSRAPRIVAGLLALAGLAGVVYAFGYRRLRSSLMTPEVKIGEVALVSPVQSEIQLTATGYVVALVYAKVASKVPGRIAEIFVEEGQTIEKGARVARLEDIDFKTALATARARATAARAKVAVARAGVAEIRVQIDRETPMVDKGVTAKATLDDLQARRDSATAGVRAAEAEAQAADAEVRALEIQLGSYEIITPISGTVVDKLVKVGEGVSPGFGTPGVIEVIDMASLVVEVDVPEARLSQVAVDAPCEIVLDAYPAKRFRGAVKEIGRRVNRSKATVPVKIRFLDPPQNGTTKGRAEILPEMAARVSFLSQAVAGAVVQRGGDAVFVVDDGEVRMTPVQLGPPVGDGRELVTKLPPGTKVVVDPPADLHDGQKVKENRSR